MANDQPKLGPLYSLVNPHALTSYDDNFDSLGYNPRGS